MQLIIKQDDPFSEISQAITPEQKRAILAYIGALKSPLISCQKCDDTGSLSKSVYGDRDCHYCDRADESARVLAWYKSARTDGGDADTLNVYYHGVAAGADLQRARIAELEREVAANREKIAAGSVPTGWKLVPIEPTDDMRFATTHTNNSLDTAEVMAMLRAAIAAAPSPADNGDGK